jgi:hypothetical protein
MARKRASGRPPEDFDETAPAGGSGGNPPGRGRGKQSKEPEPIEVTDHRMLLTRQAELFERLHANPEAARLLLINPVLAFGEVGVSFSPEISRHILHTIQHPPALRRRREELEERLERELGTPPRPNDPGWVSEVLFERLKIRPLATTGHEPVYTFPLPEGTLERLKGFRREPNPRYPPTQRARRGMTLKLAPWRPAFRRMDLDAPLPKLQAARTAPKEVDLETLYFYRESHPLARDLLELGIIQRRSFPIHSGDSYRKIRSGEKPNAFHAWIRRVEFRREGEG